MGFVLHFLEEEVERFKCHFRYFKKRKPFCVFAATESLFGLTSFS